MDIINIDNLKGERDAAPGLETSGLKESDPLKVRKLLVARRKARRRQTDALSDPQRPKRNRRASIVITNPPNLTNKNAKFCKRASSTPFIRWLRKRTFQGQWGKLVDGHHVYTPTKEQYVRNQYWGHHAQLSNAHLQNHFNGFETYFFQGTALPESVAMIDIDVQKALKLGTTKGAWQFAREIEKLFPGIFGEGSTYGKGVHQYIVVVKDGATKEEANEALDHLQKYLRYLKHKTKADIEQVEVKGKIPIIKKNCWGVIDHAKDIHCGTLAKIPRGDCSKTARITVAEIKKLQVPADYQPKAPITCAGSCCVQLDLTDLDQYPVMPSLKVHGLVVKQGDWNICFKILQFMFANANNDPNKPEWIDTLPVRRIGNIWDSLYKSGQVERGWNHNRFTAMRNWLSQHGWLDWSDNKYRWNNGKGIACKWAIHEELDEILSTKREERDLCVRSSLQNEDGTWKQGPGLWKKPTPFLLELEDERLEREFWEKVNDFNENLALVA